MSRVIRLGISGSLILCFSIYAQNIKSPKWSVSSGEPDVGDTGWNSPAIGPDGTVYFGAKNGKMWALNPDLSIKWNYKYEYGGHFYEAFASPILTLNGLVIMGNEKGYLNGHDKETGKLVWKYPDTDEPPEEWWRTPSVNAKGILIVGSEKSGKYFGVNSEDGKLAWETPSIGLETGCFPAIADDGTIYVTGGYYGGLFAIQGDAPLADTDWPKGLQNNCNNSRFNGTSHNE